MGPHEPLAEPVAAPGLRGVDGHGAQRFAGHLPQLVAHIHAQSARVGDLHRHAFEFEGHGAFAFQLGVAFALRQFLDRFGEGRRMGYGAVAGHGLREAGLAQAVVGRSEEMFHAAMLIAQRDFEVQDLLAVADEAEGTRFDDAGVDGAHVDFVQRPAFHGVERVVVHRTGAVAAVERKAQRLGPRHVVEAHAVTLGDVALEGMERRVQGRERRVQGRLFVVGQSVRREQHLALPVVEQQAEEAEPVAGRQGEIVGHVIAGVGKASGEVVVKFGVADFGYVVQGCAGARVFGCEPVHHRAAI